MGGLHCGEIRFFVSDWSNLKFGCSGSEAQNITRLVKIEKLPGIIVIYSFVSRKREKIFQSLRKNEFNIEYYNYIEQN